MTETTQHIIPAILTGDLDLAQAQLDLCAQAQLSVAHIDVIDGQFAPALTITPADFDELEFHELKIDMHLMTEEPLDFVYELLDQAAKSHIRTVTAQVERMSSQSEFAKLVRANNWKVGFALDIFTPIETLELEQLASCDTVLVMNNEAGVQGQEVHPHAFEKLQELRELKDENEYSFEIMSDIGVSVETVAALSEAGSQTLMAGSALWNASDFTTAYKELEAEI